MTPTGHSNCSAAIRPRRLSEGRDLVPNNVDVAAQVVHLVREGQRKLDMADGSLNALDFCLLPGQMFVRQVGVERSFQGLDLGIPIEQAPTVEPRVGYRHKAEQWVADCYRCHQHRDRSLYMDG